MNPPPILFEPQFLAMPGELFDHLLTSIEWDERMKARKTASFGVSYDYSQISYEPAPMPDELAALAESIGRLLGFTPNNCLLNYYEDGNSSMGFHSDSSEELSAGTGVAIVSLGSMRSLVFRSKADKSVEFDFPLPAGSLIYMTKDVQDHWLHAVPKMRHAGPRISLTFRSIIK
ncbi:alpha-ketoglutarate-dependent dioxygenase AlkB [Duganella sp. Root198D2]|uniref:alpha-ketoglutarate-dependent dioxygenase AlkB family protein n=1 Tax=Duganella sp. Root198D2 TaxID=1736489 RepID=UPI00071034A6|nr:alpha-ketoglutarate-dependent dioxygenase AlkB [Duganella sp. Root198D2]KRB96473.1 2OG-Fe(II) oxygenase [Duganella sp. Root198D2]